MSDSSTTRLRAELAALSDRAAVLGLESRALEAELQSTTDAVVAAGADGVIVQWNHAAEVLTGWSEPQARGRPAAEVLRVVDEDQGAESEDPVVRTLRGGAAREGTEHTILVVRDGALRPIVWGGTPVLDAAGRVSGVVVAFRTRARAGKAAERCGAPFDAPVGRFRVALDGRLLHVNRAFSAMLGYSAEQLGSLSLGAITHADDQVESRERERALLTGEEDSCAGDVRYLAADGSQVWANVTMRLRRDDEGRPLGFLARVQDISERKRAEHALAESELRYRRLFEAAKDGILILDAVDGVIVDVNPFLTALTGFSRQEFLEKHLWEIGAFKDIAASKELFAELQDKGVVRYDDLPLKASDGRRIDVEFVSNVYLADDRRVIQCNVRDISARLLAEKERGRLEAQLRASQKLEAIGSLAGGVAHDFNNLLSVILSYTSLALDRVPEGDPLRDDLLEVKSGGERAAALTRQLLAFGCKQVLQAVPLSLNRIATGLEKMLRRVLGEDIEYVQALAPDLGVVIADPGQMEQVLMNLVVNARDAMPKGGKLTVETSNIEIDGEYAVSHVAMKPGPYVQLSVTDTGCGMDLETRARIFEPFFTTKEKGKGSGLGLAVVYGIVRQSGGNIWVYSEPGLGTTFKIYLPRDLSDAPAVETRPAAVPSRLGGTETVLVVEDEPVLLEVSRRTLAAAGYTVLTAASGEEALQVFAHHAGDVQLLATDVVMPRMSGRALAEELTRRRPSLKVLYMSGYADDTIVRHGGIDAGTAFLPKPFTGSDLARKVRQVLDGEGPEHAVDAGADAGVEEHPLDEAAVRALPRELLDRLAKAAIAARYDDLLALADVIGATEPQLGAGLRQMVDRFDYEGVRGVLVQ